MPASLKNGRRALLEVASAYRHLVKVGQSKMSDADKEYMKKVEGCISRAIMHLPRDRDERRTLRRFVEKLAQGEVVELAEFPCV